MGSGMPHGKIAVLGLVTIAAYGTWFYSFGVLLDPIIDDTGWSESLLTATFSVSALLGGLGAVGGGRFLDRYGSRSVFLTGAALSLTGFLIAAWSPYPLLFAGAAALSGGTLAALGFYHVTQTAAVRVSPGNTHRAIAVLTIWGAFSSAIYLPLAALLVQSVGWRATLTVLAISVAATLVLGGVLIDTRSSGVSATRNLWTDLRLAVASRPSRRFLIAEALSGVGVATILVYQVPSMTAAGLPLAAASFWAGARGFSQLFGRLPLMPIVDRLGVVGSLRLSYTATATGSLVLIIAGAPWLAAMYAVVAGFGIGAHSPLVGMHSNQIFEGSGLGSAMGLVGMVSLVLGSLGPFIGGLVAETTGSRVLPVLGASIVVYLAAFVVGGVRHSRESRDI